MWQKREKSLHRKFEFKDFDEALEFIEKVAEIARRSNHHPKITNMYNIVELELSTHSAGDTVTEKDEQFARQVDELFKTEQKKPGQKLKQAKLYVDGGSRGNPGPSALGYVITDMDDSVVKKDSKYLGVATNNQAEYLALKQGIEAVKPLGVRELDIYMDSELIVKQMTGLYKVKNKELFPLNQAVRKMITGFKNVTFTHVPRELNKTADSMVNECLDSQEK